MTRAGSSSCSRRRMICACCAARRSAGNAASAAVEVRPRARRRASGRARRRARRRCRIDRGAPGARPSSPPRSAPAQKDVRSRNMTSANRTVAPPAPGDRRCGAAGEQRPQAPDCPEQMHANGRLVQPGHGAHFARRPAFEMTQHEYHSLPFGQLRERRRSAAGGVLPPAPDPRDSAREPADTPPGRARRLKRRGRAAPSSVRGVAALSGGPGIR